MGEGAYDALSKIPSAQLDTANPGPHLSDNEAERYKELLQSIKFEARPSNAFHHLTKAVTQSSLVGSLWHTGGQLMQNATSKTPSVN